MIECENISRMSNGEKWTWFFFFYYCGMWMTIRTISQRELARTLVNFIGKSKSFFPTENKFVQTKQKYVNVKIKKKSVYKRINK